MTTPSPLNRTILENLNLRSAEIDVILELTRLSQSAYQLSNQLELAELRMPDDSFQNIMSSLETCILYLHETQARLRPEESHELDEINLLRRDQLVHVNNELVQLDDFFRYMFPSTGFADRLETRWPESNRILQNIFYELLRQTHLFLTEYDNRIRAHVGPSPINARTAAEERRRDFNNRNPIESIPSDDDQDDQFPARPVRRRERILLSEVFNPITPTLTRQTAAWSQRNTMNGRGKPKTKTKKRRFRRPYTSKRRPAKKPRRMAY